MPTRGSKDPNGRALRGRRAHTTFALLTDPARQIWNSFNNRANAGGADAPEAAVNGCLYDRFKSLYNKTATKPSLVIVPARFKSGTLYSQIPSSNADFTVTRALNTATRFDSSALIQAGITSGIPRLDYYTSGGVTGCPALLVEPAATNLCRYSEQFDTVTSGWTAVALQTITGNTTATLDPAGGNTADLIVATTGTTNHDIRPSADNLPAFVSGTTYTYSIFAKATSAESGFVQMYFGAIGFSPASPYANFQLTGNGAVVTGTSGAAIQSFGNGWYRCSITATAAANGNAAVPIQPILTSGVTRNGTFAGNGVDGVYLWGAQLETGSVATSYIPTTAGTGSRSADVISVSGAVSGSIGQTEGTIYCEFEVTNNTANRRVIAIGDGGATNRILLFTNISNYFARIMSTDVTIGALSVGYHKVAIGYQKSGVSGSIFVSVDGGAVVSGTANSFPASLTHCILGSNENVGSPNFFINARIRAAALYTTRLTNAELALITQP